MLGIEIVKDRLTQEPAPELRDQIVEASFQRGLLLLGCGDTGIRFSPSLVVTKREATLAIGILEESLKSVTC